MKKPQKIFGYSPMPFEKGLDIEVKQYIDSKKVEENNK